MLSMSYSLAPDALVPGLDDAARIGIFDSIVELHEEQIRDQEMAQLRGDLRARWSK